MYNFFKKLFETKLPPLGALIDNRSDEEKLFDNKFEEIVASADPVKWEDRKPREFPLFWQYYSSRCCAYSAAKFLLILLWLKEKVFVPFSACDIYKRRTTEEGMNAYDMWRVLGEGVTLEALVPSDNKTDKQNDATVIEAYKHEVGKIFKVGQPIILPIGDVSSVASVIQKTGKGVILFYFFNQDEWSLETPVIKKNLTFGMPSNLYHAVVAVDYGLKNGKKGLWIEDSAKFGSTQRRFITEEFHAKRNYYAAYAMNFKFDIPNIKPRFSGSISSMQDCLKYEGFFPINTDSTGFYRAITRKAVEQFCKKYNVELSVEWVINIPLHNKLKELYN